MSLVRRDQRLLCHQPKESMRTARNGLCALQRKVFAQFSATFSKIFITCLELNKREIALGTDAANSVSVLIIQQKSKLPYIVSNTATNCCARFFAANVRESESSCAIRSSIRQQCRRIHSQHRFAVRRRSGVARLPHHWLVTVGTWVGKMPRLTVAMLLRHLRHGKARWEAQHLHQPDCRL